MAQECPICMGNIIISPLPASAGKRLSASNCGHTFHRECLIRWTEIGRARDGFCACPVCRKRVTHVLDLFPQAVEPEVVVIHEQQEIQIQALQQKLTEVQPEKRQLQEDKDTLSRYVDVKARILEAFQNAADIEKERHLRQSQIQVLQQKLCDLSGENRQLQDEKNDLQEQNRQLQEQNQALFKDVDAKSEIIATYRNMIIEKEEGLYREREETKQFREILANLRRPLSQNSMQIDVPDQISATTVLDVQHFDFSYSCNCKATNCQSGNCGCKKRNKPCNPSCHCASVHECCNPASIRSGCQHFRA